MKEKNTWSKILTKEYLEKLHFIEGLNLNQIARKVGCHVKTVHDYCSRHYITPNVRKVLGNQHGCWRGHGEIPAAYWSNIQNGARLRKLDLTVTIEQGWELFLSQNRQCKLSGREIGFGIDCKNSASLDRIDASKGYILENIQWVHKDLNYAKQSLNNEDFIKLCNEVTKHNDN